MEVVESKIVAGVIIFLATLLSGVLPYILFRRAAARASVITETLQDIMQAFACGVFIATCLLYLVPEAEHSISHAVDSDLPVAMIIIALGVLLTLFLEQAFILYTERSQKGSTIALAGHHHHHHHAHHHQQQHQKKSSEFHNGAVIMSAPNSGRSEKTSPISSTYHNYGSVDELVDGSLGHGKEGTMVVSENGVIPVSFDEKNPLLLIDKDATTYLPEDKRTGSTTSNKTSSSTAQPAEAIDDYLETGSKNETTSAKMKESVLRSVVLILALSFHTVFDGLVVGVQDTETEVWTLLSAITLHKALEALSISLSLVDSHGQHPRSTFLYLFLFSLVSPLGLAIGTALTESSIDEEAQNLASGILQSIAAGTFMYATFVESMKDRFEGRFKLLKVLVAVFGFACVCLVRLFTKDHSH